jgi:arsenite methyltransferase
MNTKNDTETTRQQVREGYAAIARASDAAIAKDEPAAGGCCGPQGGCGVRTDAAELAREIGYSAEEIAMLPEGANMGLSCGNPAAIASLKPGEVVLDLGSGGGFDCFLIGPKVGATGRAIGVDMTSDMLTKARKNLAAYRARSGLDNIEFRLGEIEHLPVADASIDVVISNCVLNLSPDQPQVWREIARVLKPGGRVAVSDLGLSRALPEKVRASVEALVGCVAGAALIEDTDRMMRDAGLVNIQLRPKPEYVRALESFQDPLYAKIAEELPANTHVSDYVTSLDIAARKPGVRAKCC